MKDTSKKYMIMLLEMIKSNKYDIQEHADMLIILNILYANNTFYIYYFQFIILYENERYCLFYY